MADSSNLVRVLDWIGIGVCVILVLIDLRIKNDLIRAAIRLENRLADGNRKFVSEELTDIYGDIPPSNSNHLPDHANSKVENDSVVESPEWQTPPTPRRTSPKRKAGNADPGIPGPSE